MDLNSTNPAATTARTTKLASASETAAAPTSDFQTFLTLLTAQMRKQDPLKPLESTEFVAQLASFSAVEQQVRSNDRLDRIVEVLAGGTADGLAAWIGKEVRAPAPASYAGVPVEVEVTADPEADRAVLVVRNDFDQVVARRAVDPAATSVLWDGQSEAGQPQAHGRYSFELESYRGEELIGTEPGQTLATVTEVRLEAGAPRLVLEGGAQIGIDEVTAIR
jgi:flagellar basal-body rod modification protein FlgD